MPDFIGTTEVSFSKLKGELDLYFANVNVGHYRFMALCDVIDRALRKSKSDLATTLLENRISMRASEVPGYHKALNQIVELARYMVTVLTEAELEKTNSQIATEELSKKHNDEVLGTLIMIKGRIFATDVD